MLEWKLKWPSKAMEHTLTATLVPADGQALLPRWTRDEPISLSYTVPAHAQSGVQIRFLRIFQPGSRKPPAKWVGT